MNWFVYIARARTGRLYTGITNDPEKRIDKHNAGRGSRMANGNNCLTLPNMLLELRKDFGDKMAMVKTSGQGAVLILVDRVEQEGPFFIQRGDPRHYPIIKFEKPPELCGVKEPVSVEIHQELRGQFVEALVAVCKENDIDVVYCAGTDNPNAEPYRNDLAHAGIELQEYSKNFS